MSISSRQVEVIWEKGLEGVGGSAGHLPLPEGGGSGLEPRGQGREAMGHLSQRSAQRAAGFLRIRTAPSAPALLAW